MTIKSDLASCEWMVAQMGLFTDKKLTKRVVNLEGDIGTVKGDVMKLRSEMDDDDNFTDVKHSFETVIGKNDNFTDVKHSFETVIGKIEDLSGNSKQNEKIEGNPTANGSSTRDLSTRTTANAIQCWKTPNCSTKTLRS